MILLMRSLFYLTFSVCKQKVNGIKRATRIYIDTYSQCSSQKKFAQIVYSVKIQVGSLSFLNMVFSWMTIQMLQMLNMIGSSQSNAI